MMNLTLMKNFFDTVDGEWRSPLLDQIAAPWFAQDAGVYILRASANFVAVVKTGPETYFLRFNHASERSPEWIAAELDYIQRLAAGGVRVARPRPSRAGRWMESVETPLGTFHAVLFEQMPGEQLEFESLDLAAVERWGRAAGEIHRAVQGWRAPARFGWQDWLEMAGRVIPPSESAARRELESVAAALAALPVTAENYGLVHFDFELDNLCWQGEQAGVIDCDDCSYHWFAAEIAFALRDLFADRPANIHLADERLQAFLRGYRAVRPLPAEELRLLPLFLRFNNLVGFARSLYSINAGPIPGEPDWTRDLRAHLAGLVDGYRNDFEAHPLR